MSAVQQALSKLSRAIDSLEGSLGSFEDSLKGQQRDMFAAPQKIEKVANNNAMNTDLVAQKLDSAIARIESVLKGAHG